MILLLKVFRQSASTVNSKLPTDSFQGMFEQMFLSKWNCWLHIKLFICFKIHVIMGFLVRCCLNCFNWMPILCNLCCFFLSVVVALVHWFIWLCWTHVWMMKTFKLWRFDLLTLLLLYLVMNVCSEGARYCFCLPNIPVHVYV